MLLTHERCRRQVNLLDAKRSLNVSIFLRQFHSSGGGSPTRNRTVTRRTRHPASAAAARRRHSANQSLQQADAPPSADGEDGSPSVQAMTMTADTLRNLLKILPDEDETKLLRSYDGDRLQLGQAERFLLELLDLPE
jgi:hypothetical protein